jgi:hypothetical protein
MAPDLRQMLVLNSNWEIRECHENCGTSMICKCNKSDRVEPLIGVCSVCGSWQRPDGDQNIVQNLSVGVNSVERQA